MSKAPRTRPEPSSRWPAAEGAPRAGSGGLPAPSALRGPPTATRPGPATGSATAYETGTSATNGTGRPGEPGGGGGGGDDEPAGGSATSRPPSTELTRTNPWYTPLGWPSGTTSVARTERDSPGGTSTVPLDTHTSVHGSRA